MPKAELVYRPANQSEKAEAGDYEHLCHNYEGFRLFVKWKSRNRYRSKKETLDEMLKNIKFEERALAKQGGM